MKGRRKKVKMIQKRIKIKTIQSQKKKKRKKIRNKTMTSSKKQAKGIGTIRRHSQSLKALLRKRTNSKIMKKVWSTT